MLDKGKLLVSLCKTPLLFSVFLLLAAASMSWAAPVLQISVYQATLSRDGDHLVVKEAYSFENPQNVAVTPATGGLLFSIPENIHGNLAVTVNAAGERREAALKSDPSDVSRWLLSGPLAPGRTSVTIAYALPYSGEIDFTRRFFYPTQNLRLFIRPENVTVEGAGVHRQENVVMTGFATYFLDPLPKASTVSIHLTGGVVETAPTPAQTQMNPPVAEEEWHVQMRPNRFSEKNARIVFFLMLTVLLGLGLVYANGQSARIEQNQRNTGRKRSELYRLEDRFVTGHLSREEFLVQREQILAKTTAKAKKRPSGKTARRA